MKGLERDSGSDRRRERHEVRAAMAGRQGGAAAIRDDELAGYGSTAAWSRAVGDE
jgi:hypothetical protein